jgi:C4-dicarboxylate-specific signal transduction histidine kinase
VQVHPHEDSSQEVSLSIVDNGPGLGAQARTQLLQPFFTGKDAQLGLGLTITRQALMETGARLEAGNEPGRGARFSVILRTAAR